MTPTRRDFLKVASIAPVALAAGAGSGNSGAQSANDPTPGRLVNVGCDFRPTPTGPQATARRREKKPTEYLRQLVYDALVFTHEALRHLIAEVGASQIMMGTDHPFPWEERPVDYILNVPSLSEAERVAMLGGTALRLLGMSGDTSECSQQ